MKLNRYGITRVIITHQEEVASWAWGAYEGAYGGHPWHQVGEEGWTFLQVVEEAWSLLGVHQHRSSGAGVVSLLWGVADHQLEGELSPF